MLHLASTIVLVLIAAGIYFRRITRIHMRFMLAAFLTDVSILLYVEITRHAVERVVARIDPMVWFHAGVSVLVLAAYVVQLVLGRKLAAGKQVTKKQHLTVGVTFCALRLTNYVTSWML